MNTFTRFLLAAIASGATVTYAQTSSSCNPTAKDGCPSDPALAKAVEYDLTKGAPEDFTVSTGSAPVFTKDGAVFTIDKKGAAPTLISKWYMMFGHYDVKVKVAPGQGVVSSLVLLSDDLDELDFEWLGAKPDEVQTNYFGKGLTTSYTRGMTVANPGSQATFHTYSLDWTSDLITWSIDGKVVRSLTPQTAEAGQYPQSPMQLKIGPWVAGDVGQPQGTVEWAGGLIDWSKAPYQMTVTSIKAVDYSTGKSYSYGDRSGSWQSIKSDGGKISGKGDPNTPVSQAAASGTVIAATASGAAATQPATPDNKPLANANGTANATVTTTAAGSSASGNATKASGSGSASASKVTGSGSGSTTAASATTGSGIAQGNGASRVGAGVGALAFVAVIMVL